MKLTIFALIGLTVCSLPAVAWNRAGHMVSGAIAYSELQQADPKKVQKIVTLLKSHPDYESHWKPELEKAPLTANEKDQYLFTLAARWPDEIRHGGEEFNRPAWHYVNLPFTPGVPIASTVTIPSQENIFTAFPKNVDILKSNASNSDRAVAFCWFEHLGGDVHQPLHTTKLITAQYPEPDGDRGGNKFYIRVRPNSKTISLHEFWDDLILGSEQFRAVRNKATELRSRGDLKRGTYPQLAEIRFENWAKNESFKLAQEIAYRNGSLVPSNDKANGTVLPSDYAASAKGVAERQIVLAGYRIADLMQKLF